MQPLPPLPSTVFGQGGQSMVYEHPTRPELLVKVFTDGSHVRMPRVGPEATHIESLNEFQNGITYSHRAILSRNFSWPVEIYGNKPGVIEGIGILRAPDDFWIDVNFTTGKSRKYFLNLGFMTTAFLESRSVASAPFRDVSFEDRVEVSLEYLYSLQVLWELGYRFCDFKEQNFSFTLRGRPRVFIIDAESVSPPFESEIRSPDWHPYKHPDYSMESDRSLAFLLVWRILAKDPGVRPPQQSAHGYLGKLDRHTLSVLEDGWRSGSQDLIDELVRCLVRYRSDKNIRAGFEWALSTQLATLVLRYAPPNPSRQEAQILEDAREQRLLEDELMALTPRLRLLRKNRSVPRPGFLFDIPDSVVIGEIDRDAELIRQLALDGEYEEVAQAFKGRDSGDDVGRVATRSIQVAISRLGPPPLRTTTNSSGEVRVQWSWPGTDVVTGARIRLYTPDGAMAQEGYCDRARRNPSLTFSPRAPLPDGSRVVVCYAMHFDDGVTVVCPLGAETVINRSQSSTSPDSGAASSPTSAVVLPDVSSRVTDVTLQGEFGERSPEIEVGRNSAIKVDMGPVEPPSKPSIGPLAGRVRQFFSNIVARIRGRRRHWDRD
jgi:hypothetical protein